MTEKNIVNMLQDEFIGYASEILVNNLPSIDGLLPVNRKVIWGMYRNGVTHNKPFIKMLRASSMAMVYYVFGDMPLTSAMKNMGNNSVNYFYLEPKGSFGDKQRKEGVGASPRYIECKLSDYSESMLLGINKNNVKMKRNFDNTENEPIILPSVLPNLILNTGQSISVGEASKIPSHNLIEVVDSFVSYIKDNNIETAISLLKGADFSFGGQILYNKETFEKIYKTGRGSFTLIGKYIFDAKENKLSVTEIPYETYIEDIESKLRDCYDKGIFKEIVDIHDGTDKDGLRLDVYLKKNTNINQFVAKLRKYTPYESKFPCNFTVLDLDGKTPMLMSLENIIVKWTQHRINCIKSEIQFDINKNTEELNKFYGLKIINQDLDKAIQIIRNSKTEKIAMDNLISHFKLNQKQAEYVSSIRLVNINQEWMKNKIKDISKLEEEIIELTNYHNSDVKIKETIVSQLEDGKKKYGRVRGTEILYEDTIQDISKSDLIEDYSTYCILTKDNYLKKLLKRTDDVKLKENDEIVYSTQSSNKSTLLLFSNKGSCFKVYQHDIDECKPSNLGEYLPNILSLEKDECIIAMVSTRKYSGFLINVFENGLIAKVDMKSFKTKTMRSKLEKALNIDSKLLQMVIIEKDIEILLASVEGKSSIINTKQINSKGMKDTHGIVSMNLGEFENNKVIGYIINVNLDNSFTIKTEKEKELYFLLNDIAPTGKENEERTLYNYLQSNIRAKGSFLYNCRAKNDKIIEFK